MRVTWIEFCNIDPDSYGGEYTPIPATRYSGEVINVIRSWGDTKLVVMLDSGSVTEVLASKVERDRKGSS